MKRIKIITDSASDITDEMSKELDICVLPLTISFGNKEYLDFIEISADEFVELLKENKAAPKTSMVSTYCVEQAIEKYSKEYDEVLYITISDGISGTYNGAKIAKENVKEKTGRDNITIYNSNTFSIGQAMLVKLASEMAAIGECVSNIVKKMNELRKRQRCLFVLDDLSYAKSGGRVSAAEAMIGSILDIKPIFEINMEGKPSVINKARGMNKTLEKIGQLITKDLVNKFDEVWYIHCDGLQFIKRLEKLVEQQFEPAKSYFCKARGCIGTHGGPGLFGISYYI